MQVAFLTLFLGLTLGSYPVELAVEGPVAAVELWMDGAQAGRIAGPPWKGTVDFGSALAPHDLVARALDAQGQEVARARQSVNLPRPAAEVELVLEGGEGGKPASAARLSWRSLTGEKPDSVRLTLDGQPLALDAAGRAALPASDGESAHVLSADLRFPENVVARKDVVFGGRYGSEVSTELTAVPVRVRKGRTPAVGALQGRFFSGATPLTVAAVDEGPGEVLIVRDLGATAAVKALRGSVRPLVIDSVGRRGMSFDVEPLRFEAALRKRDEVRFVWPVPKTFAGSGGLPAELFPVSRAYTLADGGMYWFLTHLTPAGNAVSGGQRLADAVAVAGLQAAAGNQPRAVVLILGGSPEDASRYDPATVRRYLAAIRVPFFVWSLEKGAAKSPGPAAHAWGEALDISTLDKLRTAASKLRDSLESQRIVWLEGIHLPQTISLSPGLGSAAVRVELP